MSDTSYSTDPSPDTAKNLYLAVLSLCLNLSTYTSLFDIFLRCMLLPWLNYSLWCAPELMLNMEIEI